jgi:uncharacterized membrane protein
MLKNIKFFFTLLSQKIWIKPLISSLLSIGAAFLAQLADTSIIADISPVIQKSSIESLLTTISASMLVIAIFAVGAMLSAFSAASGTATPRSFKLVVADDVSQNALSIFIGSFIFSIVATIALQNGLYGKAGYFLLFILTLIVFGTVIITFLKWVESISKLGRLSNTIKKVEDATSKAMKERKSDLLLGGIPVRNKLTKENPVFSNQIGYVQHIKMDQLQELAISINATFYLNCLPGAFTAPDKPLIYLVSGDTTAVNKKLKILNNAFVIDKNRSFHGDPRFGLITLSEIASRALSPGINDPGTAISIIGSYVRIFTLWLKNENEHTTLKVKYDRIEVPEISLADMFDDAFRPIARDGAGNLEVMLQLQKAFKSVHFIASPEVKEILHSHSRQAYERAKYANYSDDLELIRKASIFANVMNENY